MSFPETLTATLSGTTLSQLYTWRSSGILIPEDSPKQPPLYSFRDVVALRTVAFLRSKVSLQKVRKAFETLREFDFVEHPSEYLFGTDGKTIVVQDYDGTVLDLVTRKGQTELFTMQQIFQEFTNFNGDSVVNFEHPRPNLELNSRRMGGWPTIRGTRVPYDAVADLLADGYYNVEDISNFYPTVNPSAAIDALSFASEVDSFKRGA